MSTRRFRRIEGRASDPEVGTASGALIVLVDAQNVRRSAWPNVAVDELVERCCAWAASAAMQVVVVVDGGRPEEREAGERCDVVHTGGETADDWIARHAAELAQASEPYWLVTSDRELRARAGGEAERTIGGGSFLRQLLEA